MNQDQVKSALLSLEDAPMEFTVIFSGKKSKKVNGLYKPPSREIIIHNRNFSDDNLLMYTAIHEYAHHLHACARGGVLSPRSHTAEFWAILHGLLEKAEERGVYRNVFADSPELTELTGLIRTKYLEGNGGLVKELGKHLLRAHELCTAIGARFEDYIDRVLRIPKTAANLAIRMYQYNLNPVVGPDNMRFLAGIRNDETRTAAESALVEGKSPDAVRIAARRLPAPEDPRQRLEKERTRLKRTIESLARRLGEVEQELESL
ncbi:MAG: hypothetical protein LBD78_10030 [Spirochaetaceae bacterium]|jgi:hypothetical protein|nr:hypothetical protein [Spirochaetaceae bacterium]